MFTAEVGTAVDFSCIHLHHKTLCKAPLNWDVSSLQAIRACSRGEDTNGSATDAFKPIHEVKTPKEVLSKARLVSVGCGADDNIYTLFRHFACASLALGLVTCATWLAQWEWRW